MVKRVTIFLYGLVCYAVFFATFLYAIGFVGNFLVPRGIDGVPDHGIRQGPAHRPGIAGAFAVQHSVMARPVFKRWLDEIHPGSAERSTYVLAAASRSSCCSITGSRWAASSGTSRMGPARLIVGPVRVWMAAGAGGDLPHQPFRPLRPRQVWLQLRGRPYATLRFSTPGPYRLVRHPLYLGWLFAFWATPTMTVTHLVFAVATTAYILIAIQLEERDLVSALGDDYRHYRERVPMIFPLGRRDPRSEPQAILMLQCNI